MRNILLLIIFGVLLVMSFITEPINDTLDAVGGATNETYSASIDSVAGATNTHDDDDEHEDDDYEDDEQEEEDDD